MFLFGSLFYYGLLWLGLISGPRQTRVFVISGIVGALAGVGLAYSLDGSLRFAGVGLPIGFLAGVALYAAISALAILLRRVPPASEHLSAVPRSLQGADLLLLAALLSSVVGHFIEIHFGIAVAATRTYFWIYAALFVSLGLGLVSVTAPQAAEAPSAKYPASGVRVPSRSEPQRQSRTRSRERPSRTAVSTRSTGSQKRPAIERAGNPSLSALAVLAGMVLITMFWDYTTNPLGQTDPLAVLVTSLTTMASRQAPEQVSLGMLALFVVTGLVALGISVPEYSESGAASRERRDWLALTGQALAIMGSMGVLYGIIHAARLGPSVNLPNLTYEYYVALGVVGLALAIILYRRLPRPANSLRGWQLALYLASVLVALVVINAVNINVVRADVLYKQGLRYDQQGSWEGAAGLYGKAIEMTPNQDFYYLFRGRALMEQAKQESDARVRVELLSVAEDSLQTARQLNPLNTDHTANLGRLYRTWAEMASDEADRRAKLDLSLQEYGRAVELSPNNAQLWDEWASVYMAVGDSTEALAKLQRSLELDPQYTQTYLLLGDMHLSRQEWTDALKAYEQLVSLDPKSVPAWSSMGYAYSQLGQLDKAIDANKKILQIQPDDYNTLKNLALLYGETSQPEDAAHYAQLALNVAPEQDKAGLRQYIEEQQALVAGAKP